MKGPCNNKQSNSSFMPAGLSEAHRKMLYKDSGIAPDVVAERGYKTARSRAELLEFKKYQRRVPSLYIPMHSPCGRTMAQIRPDNPRKAKDGKPRKYDTPTGVTPPIDVHPRNMAALEDATRRLWITEGVRKGDAMTSRGEVVISLAGVYMWGKGGKLDAAWDYVVLEGRDVLVVFDSDIMHKPEVAGALDTLSKLLEERGATVSIVYLNDGPNGVKVGADDYLAAGGTTAEMVAKAVPYRPQDFEYLRTERNVGLKDALARMWQLHAEMPTRTDAHNTRRSVFRSLIRRAQKYGYVRGKRVLVSAPTRSLAIDARVGHKTVARHVAALCEEGTIELEKKPAGKKAGCYAIVLPCGARSSDTYKGESPTGRESFPKGSLPNNVTLPVIGASLYVSQVRASGLGHDTHEKCHLCSTYDPCVSQVRARQAHARAHKCAVPELRWSAPGRKPSKTEIRASRTGASKAPLTRVSEPVTRLGKRRGAIVEYVLEAGGSCTIKQLIGRFAGESTRTRDFVRRQLKPLTYPAVITIKGGCVSLTENWREALEEQRDLGREAEANELQEQKIRDQRRAYHDDIEVDETPEIPVVDDMSKPWSYHEEGCACRECSERFGAVVGAHVEGCGCKVCCAKREGRKLPGQAVVWREADPPIEPPEDPSEDHPLDCECFDCSYVPRTYARLAV